MERLWQTMARLSHHLGKGRLVEWTAEPLKSPLQILPLCLSWFCLISATQKPLLIVPPTPSIGPFLWWALLKWRSSCTDLSKCVINANTYLEWNCDEHPSLHKMTFSNESFIFFSNSLTMVLVEVNSAIREWSLDLVITATGIFAKSPCFASR